MYISSDKTLVKYHVGLQLQKVWLVTNIGKFSTGAKILVSSYFAKKTFLVNYFQKFTLKIIYIIRRRRSLSLVLDMYSNPLIIHVAYTTISHVFWCRFASHDPKFGFLQFGWLSIGKAPIFTNLFCTIVTRFTLCSIKTWRTLSCTYDLFPWPPLFRQAWLAQ